jgi:hypothetical protein
MRIFSKLSLMTAGIAAVGLTSIAVVAAAPNSHANAAATAQATGQPSALVSQADANKPSDPGSQSSTRLADAKLKACQNREKAINNIMSRIADRGQKQINLFTSIAERTEKFYADKGKTLSNYDALVAEVNAKKAAAQTAVDAVKDGSVTFKCDGSDPKGAASGFKDALKSEIAALKAYRTSVKNLIVGVKSVQGSTTSSDKSQGGQQ